MQEKINIAVFFDYDNIEIGVKSTLRRDFRVAPVLDALKERGVIVAKFAYANWGRQEPATRQMAENAVQMVQRIPSPRGDKNGADINLALDALEMAFTHPHVNAFAIVSGDSDFIPLVNKLKEYGKTVFIVGGKAFTSTILQQNCHEFVSYESLLDDLPPPAPREHRDRLPKPSGDVHEAKDARDGKDARDVRDSRQPRPDRHERPPRTPKERPASLDLGQAMPLVDRALEVLERRGVQAQLGLLKSTMLQLVPSFSEKAYGAHSFSEFVDLLRKGDFVQVHGGGGRMLIERKHTRAAGKPLLRPDDALPLLRDVLEDHRLEIEEGVAADQLQVWVGEASEGFDCKVYGFQEFNELLNFAQDRTVVRIEPDEEKGLTVYLGAEFYPPAPPEHVEEERPHIYYERQPYVEGQPTIFEPDPKPVSPRSRVRRPPRKEADGNRMHAPKRPRRKKHE